MRETMLTISEAAKELHIETHVLRYWEEELDMTIPRNDMGHRVYGQREMKLFHNIMELKDAGFQLRVIKLLLKDVEDEDSLDIDKLIKMKDEIHRKIEALPEQPVPISANVHKRTQLAIDDTGKVIRLQVVRSAKNTAEISEDKLQQFRYVMLQIMGEAMKTQTIQLTESVQKSLKAELNQQLLQCEARMKKEISEDVSTRVMKEMNYLSRVQEEQEEERFKKLDELLREKQQKAKKERGIFKSRKMKNKKLETYVISDQDELDQEMQMENQKTDRLVAAAKE